MKMQMIASGEWNCGCLISFLCTVFMFSIILPCSIPRGGRQDPESKTPNSPEAQMNPSVQRRTAICHGPLGQ